MLMLMINKVVGQCLDVRSQLLDEGNFNDLTTKVDAQLA
jgi:hypothetical protein